MSEIKSIRQAKVKNKTVLLRADLDLPTEKNDDGNRVVTDDFRLQKGLPTIQWLQEHDAKTIIIGHLKRPKSWDINFSYEPVAEHLANVLKMKLVVVDDKTKKLPEYKIPHLFYFIQDFRTDHIKKLLSELNPKDIALLENIRFYPEEYTGDQKFSEELASLADVFVQDAFATVYHEEHCSITGVPKLLPSYAGVQLEREVEVVTKISDQAKKPFVLLVGGVKIGEKLEGLKALLDKCDAALLGGGIATLFLSAKGYEIGKSVAQLEYLTEAKDLLRNYKDKIKLPSDVIVARAVDDEGSIVVKKSEQVLPHESIFDIGTGTILAYSELIKSAKTLFWAGPMGYFEHKPFSSGTKSLGRLFASRSSGFAFGVAGGGDTLRAVKAIKMGEYIDHLSTGGTSLLYLLAGKKLPGVEILKS